jgi:uncharacterized membrane protein YcaP (DUF421 family)
LDSIIRAGVAYVILLLIFRVYGKRSLAQITTFDFILLLVISEAVAPSLIGNDASMTNSFLLVLTLLGIELFLSLVQPRIPALQKVVEDVPLILVENGRMLEDRMRKARVDQSDILATARLNQGVERMEQIRYAILERNGNISIIPEQSPSS